MPRINGEPEPTRFVDEDEISFSNRHFDWRGRNQYPLPPAPPMRPDPTITPSYPCDFGAFDFVGQPIKRAYNWMNSFGFRTNWELILGLFTPVHPIYWLLYGFNAWLYMYNLVVLIVLISTMIYRSRYEQKPKRKTNGEKMTSISDLFEGYEERPQAPEPQPTFVTKR